MRRLVPCPSCKRHLFVDDEATQTDHGAQSQGACPHCGTREIGGVALLAVAASLALAACSSPEPVAVYGPAPERSDARTAAPTTSSPTPPQVPVAVYGPAPIDPSQRVDAGPLPSASAPPPHTSATPVPTTPLTTRSPAPIYGPPPRSPDQRLDSKDPSKP